MPAISIVVPVYNVAPYLDQSIHSILNQTYSDWEAIFINDGSTDESLEILNKFSSLDSRIRVITQPNGGVASARNKGIELAQGEFIYFFDPDDWLDPGLLNDNVRLIKSCDADLVFFGCRIYKSDSDVKTVANSRLIFLGDNRAIASSILEIAEGHLIMNVWNKIFRRRNLMSAGIRFPSRKMGEDSLFVLDVISESSKLVVNPLPYYNYRSSRPGGAMASIENALQVRDELYILSRLKKFFDDFKINGNGYINEWIDNSIFSKYLVIAMHCVNCGGVKKYLEVIGNDHFRKFISMRHPGGWPLSCNGALKSFLVRCPIFIYFYCSVNRESC